MDSLHDKFGVKQRSGGMIFWNYGRHVRYEISKSGFAVSGRTDRILGLFSHLFWNGSHWSPDGRLGSGFGEHFRSIRIYIKFYLPVFLQ